MTIRLTACVRNLVAVPICVLLTGCGDLSESEALAKIRSGQTELNWKPVSEEQVVRTSDVATCGKKNGWWAIQLRHWIIPETKRYPRGMQLEHYAVFIELTEAGKQAIRMIEQTDTDDSPNDVGGNDPVMSIRWQTNSPVEVTRITGIRHLTAETERSVEFRWKPNSVAAECKEAPAGKVVPVGLTFERPYAELSTEEKSLAEIDERNGLALFSRYDDGWRLKSIEATAAKRR